MTKISESSSLKELGELIQKAIEKGETDTAGSVRDVITDLLHYCDQNGIDFHDRLDSATEVFKEELSMDPEEEQKLHKYSVDIVRIGYGFHTVEVMATSQQEAREKAMDEAGNYEYSEKTAEYEVECVTKEEEE